MLAEPLEVSRLTLGHSGSSGCWQPWIPGYLISQALLTSIPIHHFGGREAVPLSLNSTHSLWEYHQRHSHGCQELGKALAQTQVPQQNALDL